MMEHTINIERPEAPRLGSCGGDAFGGNSYASIDVNGRPWGFLVGYHADADVLAGRFTWAVESSPRDRIGNDALGEVYVYLGRRKTNDHALRAAIKAVRGIISGN